MIEPPPPSFFTVRDGIRLHFRDYTGAADKAPLLCLHGLTRNARDFEDFAERYSPGHRVIALDFRGRGLSGNDPEPMRYNPLTYAGDVIELLDRLGIARAIFVGTSLGGLVTMAVVAVAPERIAATILNDVGPELGEAGLERIRGLLDRPKGFSSWDEAAAAIAENHVRAGFGQRDWPAMARRLCREEQGRVRFDYDPAIAAPFEAAPAPRVDLWPLFAALGTKPLLVVRGEHSDLVTALALARMHEAVQGMQSVTVAGAAHPPSLDEPDAVAAIDDFLAGLAD